MAEYTYLDGLPEGEAGSGSSEEFGTAAFEDTGTAPDEIPFTADVQDMIDSSAVGGMGILGVRILTTGQEVTLNNDTSRIFFILIGGGAGGRYYDWQSYGGGAGGVSIVYKSVAGGSVLGLTIGSGGSGGTYNTRVGGAGSPSTFAGISSAGGGDYVYSTVMDNTYFASTVGGAGSTAFADGVLWSKRGGFGCARKSEEDGDYQTGLGGNPWDQTMMDELLISGEEVFPLRYAYNTFDAGNGFVDYVLSRNVIPFWNMSTRSITAQYGCGGAGGSLSAQDGQDGGSGMLILVELA